MTEKEPWVTDPNTHYDQDQVNDLERAKRGESTPYDKEPTTVWGDEEERTCSLCGDAFIGMGNNPEPLAEFGQRCCNDCNWTRVIPARIGQMIERP